MARTAQGKEIFKKLVRKADVVIENFRVGTMKKLGIGYEVLKEINPGSRSGSEPSSKKSLMYVDRSTVHKAFSIAGLLKVEICKRICYF